MKAFKNLHLTKSPRLEALLDQLPELQIPPRQSAFSLFAALPSELRLKIWRNVCRIPQFIPLVYYNDDDSSGCVDGRVVNAKNKYTVPSILHANRESRELGLRYYELCTTPRTAHFVDMRPRIQPPSKMFLNFGADIFINPAPRYYGNAFVRREPILRRADLEKMRHIVISADFEDCEALYIPGHISFLTYINFESLTVRVRLTKTPVAGSVTAACALNQNTLIADLEYRDFAEGISKARTEIIATLYQPRRSRVHQEVTKRCEDCFEHTFWEPHVVSSHYDRRIDEILFSELYIKRRSWDQAIEFDQLASEQENTS